MKKLLAQHVADRLDLELNNNEFLVETGDGEYKCSWGILKRGDERVFTIYSDGYYIHENVMTGEIHQEGNTYAPHNRRWINILIKLGVYPEMAYAVVFEWAALRNV